MGISCSEKKVVFDLLKSLKDMGMGDFQLLKTRDPNPILKLKLMQVNCRFMSSSMVILKVYKPCMLMRFMNMSSSRSSLSPKVLRLCVHLRNGNFSSKDENWIEKVDHGPLHQ